MTKVGAATSSSSPGENKTACHLLSHDIEPAFAGRREIVALFDGADERFHFDGDGLHEIGNFPLASFGVKQNPSVGKVAHRSRNLIFVRNFQGLKAKADSLNMPAKPDVRVVNFFIHDAMQTRFRLLAKKIFSQVKHSLA